MLISLSHNILNRNSICTVGLAVVLIAGCQADAGPVRQNGSPTGDSVGGDSIGGDSRDGDSNTGGDQLPGDPGGDIHAGDATDNPSNCPVDEVLIWEDIPCRCGSDRHDVLPGSQCVCDDTGEMSCSLSCPVPNKMERSLWVTGGTIDPVWEDLSIAQTNAVVVVWIPTTGVCSGVVIAHGFALTAAHCVYGHTAADGVYVDFGPNPGDYNPDDRATVTSIYPNYDADLALLVLDRMPVERNVQPIPINPNAAPGVGDSVLIAGVGGSNVAHPVRTFAEILINAVTPTELFVDGGDGVGTCFGDSGGPLLNRVGDTIRVSGVGSHLAGDPPICGEVDAAYARIDLEWVESLIGRTEPVSSEPCADVTRVGGCVGLGSQRAVYCETEELRVFDCPGLDHSGCGWDPTALGYRCITGDDPCQGLNLSGICDEHIMRWCDNGVVKDFDCSACDLQCGWVGFPQGYSCIEPPCAGVGPENRCVDDTLLYCSDDGTTLHAVDCPSFSADTCGWHEESGTYTCIYL